MKKFKDYIVEENIFDLANRKQVQFLPLYHSHEGIATSHDMLENLRKTMLGRKSTMRTMVDLPGTPITFGIHPKTKKFFVSNGVNDSFSPEEINHDYKTNPVLGKKLKVSLSELPKIIPASGGMYKGRVLYTDKNDIPDYLPKSNANMGIAIESDHQGNLLTNAHKAKFQVHPDVYTVNPEIRSNPLHFDVDSQHEFRIHMNAVRNSYSKLDPDDFDAIKGHERHIEDYIQHGMQEKHTAESYLNYFKSKLSGNPQKFGKMSDEVYENKRAFDSTLSVIGHLHKAAGVLSRISVKNGNPGNVNMFRGTNTAVLKV